MLALLLYLPEQELWRVDSGEALGPRLCWCPVFGSRRSPIKPSTFVRREGRSVTRQSAVVHHRIPARPVFRHRVQRRQQLAHGRDQGHLLCLAFGEQAFVERPEGSAEPNCHQRSHIDGSSHVVSAAPNGSLTTHLTRIPVHRCHPHQRSDSAPVYLAKLRQVGDQHCDAGLANTWDGTKSHRQFSMVPSEVSRNCGVVVGKFLRQEGQHALDAEE